MSNTANNEFEYDHIDDIQDYDYAFSGTHGCYLEVETRRRVPPRIATAIENYVEIRLALATNTITAEAQICYHLAPLLSSCS